MKKLFKSGLLKICFFLYLLILIVSTSITCYFFRSGANIDFLSCGLPNLLLVSVSYIFLILLVSIKKYKLIKIFILVPLVLIPIVVLINYSFSQIYLESSIFKNHYLGPRACSDGKKIPCSNNKDCQKEKLEEYCAPSKVSPTMWTCAPVTKCSPRKICEEYCN